MLRSSRLQRLNNIDILVVIAVVFGGQRGRIVRIIGHVCIRNLCPLHVDFHDAEATDEVCILSIDADAANTLVTNDGLGVEIADVGDVTLGVYQVNV